MNRRGVIGLFVAGIASVHLPLSAFAQRRLWRIGYHSAGSAQSNAGWLDAFRQGMKELGWSEAQHYVIDARYGDGRAEMLPRLAAELVATNPDVLLTTADGSVHALFQETKTIPIVFTLLADPVGQKFAATMQRPGGNVTGVSTLSIDLTAKRLELLKDVMPGLSHVVLLFQGNDVASASQVKVYEQTATRLKVRITPIDVRTQADIDAGLSRIATLSADACAIASSFTINIHAQRIADLLIRSKLPSISSNPLYAEAGILMTYSASSARNFRRAAVYVDKILKGAKPGELAIEQPTKFDLAINGRTAKAIGVAIPQSVLLRADRVIQ